MRVNNVHLIRDDKTCTFVYTLENGKVYEVSEKDDLLMAHAHCYQENSDQNEFSFCELISVTLWLILGGLKKPDFYRSAIRDYEGIFKKNRKIEEETVFVIATLLDLGVAKNRPMTLEELNDKFSREQGYIITNFRDYKSDLKKNSK